MRLLGKTTRLLWALLIAALIVPTLPVAGGRDSGEVPGASPAEAGTQEFNCGRVGFGLPNFSPGTRTYPGGPLVDDYGVQPVMFMESTQGPISYINVVIWWINWAPNAGDRYGYNRVYYSATFDPPRDVISIGPFQPEGNPIPYIKTGPGEVTATMYGNVNIPSRTIFGVPVPICVIPDMSESSAPGHDPDYTNFPRDLVPTTADPTIPDGQGPPKENRHCESCDKKDDLAQELAMFADRDQVCDPLRKLYGDSGYDTFRTCKISGLFSIRASQTDGKGSDWYRWISANRNGWVGATSGKNSGYFYNNDPGQPRGACYRSRCAIQIVNSAMAYCTGSNCGANGERLHRPFLDMHTLIYYGSNSAQPSRPPIDQGPTLYAPSPIWQDVQDHASIIRPPAEDGTGGGPGVSPTWTPTVDPKTGCRNVKCRKASMGHILGLDWIDDILDLAAD